MEYSQEDINNSKRLKKRFRFIELQNKIKEVKHTFVILQKYEEAAIFRDLELFAAFVLECFDQRKTIDDCRIGGWYSFWAKQYNRDLVQGKMFFDSDMLKSFNEFDQEIRRFYLMLLRSLKLEKLND